MLDFTNYILTFISNLAIVLIAYYLGNKSINKYQENKDRKDTNSKFIGELSTWLSEFQAWHLRWVDLQFKKNLKSFDQSSNELQIIYEKSKRTWESISHRFILEYKNNIHKEDKIVKIDKLLMKIHSRVAIIEEKDFDVNNGLPVDDLMELWDNLIKEYNFLIIELTQHH